MQTNNIDKNIKEKLQNRTFQPSTSAWERLSVQLDEAPKQKKRGWFFYIGAAASILLLISISSMYFNKTHTEEPLEIIVNNPIDTIAIDKKINNLIDEIPVENAIVNINKTNEKLEEEKEVPLKKVQLNPNKKRMEVAETLINKEKNTFIVKVEENKKKNQENKIKTNINTLKQDPKSTIKINSDDLLYAVTHSAQDVKAYYTKHNLTKDDVLKTIKNELKLSNLKVDPNAILAEVENIILEDDFQNNFMKSLKRKVSDIATAIASRNN